MSRTQTVQVQPAYKPVADVLQRHGNGVAKTRKTPLSGSGRAWREDEVNENPKHHQSPLLPGHACADFCFLFLSRYRKHIFSRPDCRRCRTSTSLPTLNKTELACRLHYHQLSHGSNRNKRTTSCSSDSSEPRSSQITSSSPIHRGEARSLSPAAMGSTYAPPRLGSSHMQLARIMSVERSPRLPSILPKPDGLPLSRPSSQASQRYSLMTPEQHNEPLPSVSIHQHPLDSPMYNTPVIPAMRLDESRLSPPSSYVNMPPQVDMAAIQGIYEAHKRTFWGVVADEYGMGASPAALEQAWRMGARHHRDGTPMTPLASPTKDRRTGYPMTSRDKTSISSLLDHDGESRRR